MSSPDEPISAEIDAVRRRLLWTGVTGAIVSAGCVAGEFPESGDGSPAGTSPGGTAETTPSGDGSGVVAHTYELSAGGQVSAAVYDSDGTVVRTLLRSVEQDAGEHTLEWDGLDRYGRPLEPGEYIIKVLRTPGFKTEFLTELGISPDVAVYDDRGPNGRGNFTGGKEWVGNHGGPAAVAADDTGLYIASSYAEFAPQVRKQSLDGSERMWERGQFEAKTGTGAMTSTGDRLLAMQRSGTFCVVDPETGEQVDTWDVSANGGGGRGTDLASDGSTTVVSSREQDAVWWLGDDGSEEATADVPSPTGLAVGDGVVYATTDGSVVQVARSGGTRTIVDGGLTDPGRLAVDPTTGDLLVVDHAPEHSFDSERAPSRIKRYSAAGDLKAAYGREGGRLDGPYDPSNFLGVNDVAADGQGGFVVAEPRTGARRVARFDADGEHLQEWYGGAPFFTVVDPDPKDATRVWYNAIAEWLVLAEVDYENASWSIAETHHVEYENNDLMPPSTGGANYTLRVRYHDGERYLIGEGLPKVYHHTTDADSRPTLRPVAYAGSDEDRLARAKEIAGEELDGRLQYYWWTDRNGDGEPGADEIEFTTGTFWGGASTVAPDMGLLNGGSRETGPSIRRVDPDLPGGVPKYDFRERTVVGTTEYGDPTAETWGGRCSYQAPDGGYYTIHGSGAGGDRHGPQWPMTRAGTRHRLDRWSAEGEHRWSVGRHADQPPELEDTNPRGHFHNPAGIIGAPRDTVVVCDRIASPGLVYTDDGLYAGQFFDRRADDGLPETLYNWWRVPPKDEKMDAIINYDMEAEGNVVEHDGEVYWYGTGWNCAPIYRVTGWEDWQRDRGTVTIEGAPPHAAREGSGLQGAYFDSADADLGGSPTATRVDDRVWFAYDAGRFNGIEEWKGGVETLDGQATDFAVRWTGEVEAQLTEAFVFSVYTNGGGARLAVDGEVDGDWWDDPEEASQGSFKDAAVILQTDPIDLEAGERYPIRLDYRTTGEEPGVSLNWDSPSVERQRIPTAHLYPDS